MNSSLSQKRILITGASGYLAHALVEMLRGTDCELLLWSRKPAPNVVLGPDAKLMTASLEDPAAWKNAMQGVQVAFHFAAQTSVKTAAADPVIDWKANAQPMLLLLEACRFWGSIPTVIFSGTATQVGITTGTWVGEDSRDEPATIYDVHKLAAELYLKVYADEGVCRGVSLRLANVYGPGPGSGAQDRGVLNTMVRKALGGSELTIFGDGKFVRDYVYVDDVARAFLAAASYADRISGTHFVIGSGEGRTVADAVRYVAERVSAKTGKPVPVRHVPAPGAQSSIDRRNFVADISAFRTATGWQPLTPFEDGIDRTVQWFSRLSGNEARCAR